MADAAVGGKSEFAIVFVGRSGERGGINKPASSAGITDTSLVNVCIFTGR